MDVFEAFVWSVWVGMFAYTIGLSMALNVIDCDEGGGEGGYKFVGFVFGVMGFFTATVVLWMLMAMGWL